MLTISRRMTVWKNMTKCTITRHRLSAKRYEIGFEGSAEIAGWDTNGLDSDGPILTLRV